MNIFLTGATGFVGRHMVQRLLDDGHAVRALLRTLPGQKARLVQAFHKQGDFAYVAGDVVSGAGLDEAMQGCDAVIHLVGIIAEKGSNTFESVHHVGTRNVVEAARRKAVGRFVHMSAIGVRRDGVARYQTTKWKGEEVVRQSGIPYCILRPSLIFGPGDGFVTQMMDVMKKTPLFRPVPGDGSPRFRPISIDDVTMCFARALTAEAARGQTVEIGGADELSLNQVLNEIARCAGVRKAAVHVPMPLMLAVAALAERILPAPPVTTEQLRMLQEGSTCEIERMVKIFGVQPRGFQGCGREIRTTD